MVDCRNCKHHDIAAQWLENRDNENILHICWQFEMIIKRTEVKSGDCEFYVDVDSDLP